MNDAKRDRIFYVFQILLFILVFGGLGAYMAMSKWTGDERWLEDYPLLSGTFIVLTLGTCMGLTVFGHPGYRPEKNNKPPG